MEDTALALKALFSLSHSKPTSTFQTSSEQKHWAFVNNMVTAYSMYWRLIV